LEGVYKFIKIIFAQESSIEFCTRKKICGKRRKSIRYEQNYCSSCWKV